ncbi:hypothetical protein [Actinomadura sp. K4S16]|uniref:hypothetical protein n=1 Tax=Actinomadura sp. K4S16 TaxID=1316147 RepID=UPI0011ECA80B|nr:hypothetical protein [Actinomadura sp. K4S16]
MSSPEVDNIAHSRQEEAIGLPDRALLVHDEGAGPNGAKVTRPRRFESQIFDLTDIDLSEVINVPESELERSLGWLMRQRERVPDPLFGGSTGEWDGDEI